MLTAVICSNNPLSSNGIEQLAMLPCKMLSISIWCLLSSEVDCRIHEGRCAFVAHVKYIFKVDFVRCMHRSQHLDLVSFSIAIDMEQNVRLVCHTSDLIDMQRVNMKITRLPR